MKVIIAGGSGMLGIAIREALQNCEVYAMSSKEMDITCPSQVDAIVKQIRPDYIINCAAYTAVDLAETEEEKAFHLNALAVEKLAQVSKQYDATLIHFSTDYVFMGDGNKPYLPQDPVDPINCYGASKLAGEKAIQKVGCNAYIFRISWLYAPHGKNFFRWVVETENQNLKIVNSQTGSPTSALDVADFIKHLINNDPKEFGIYHFTNKGAWTWYDFALAINEKLNLGKEITPIASFETAAERPAYSVMDTSLTGKTFNYTIPSIEEGLNGVIENYKN